MALAAYLAGFDGMWMKCIVKHFYDFFRLHFYRLQEYYYHHSAFDTVMLSSSALLLLSRQIHDACSVPLLVYNILQSILPVVCTMYYFIGKIS